MITRRISAKGIQVDGKFYNGTLLVKHIGKRVNVSAPKSDPNVIFVYSDNMDLYIGPVMKVK